MRFAPTDPNARPAHEFALQVRVRFGDCDPAGIVFYPRYFEMLNGVVEAWWSALGLPWQETMAARRIGMPVSHVETHFLRPSTLGDELAFRLSVGAVNRSSIVLNARVLDAAGEPRLRVRQRMVCVSIDGHQPMAWPADIRAVLLGWMRASE